MHVLSDDLYAPYKA